MGNLDEWTRTDAIAVPQQIGGYDCGIFSLTYARYLLENRPLNFEQKHVGFLRRKICYDLIKPILCIPERPKRNQVE
jgi:sentrin-specific protease 1